MKIIDALWFTNIDGCIGIIVIEEDVTGDRKAYIGSARGKDQKVDTEKILAWGNKFSIDTAERILLSLKKEVKKEEKHGITTTGRPQTTGKHSEH